MSEVGKHYGSDVGHRPERADPAPASSGGALKSASETLSRAAGSVKDRVGDAYDKAADVSRETYGSASEWASDAYDSASRNATYARRRSAVQLKRGRRTVEDFVQENPIMVGVAGLAAGLLVGALIPGTRRENQVFGQYADEVREQGFRYANEVAEQGRHLVEENLDRLQGSRDRDTGDETSARS